MLILTLIPYIVFYLLVALLTVALYQHGLPQLTHMTRRQTLIMTSGILLWVGLSSFTFFITTYYPYFVVSLLLWSLSATWSSALCLAVAFRTRVLDPHQFLISQQTLSSPRDRRLLRSILLVFLLITGGIVWFYPGVVTTGLSALINGPQQQRGVIESVRSLRGTTIATIAGETYTVADHLLLASLATGAPMDFITDPQHTVAFAHTGRTPTTMEFALIMGSVSLWLGTLGYCEQALHKQVAQASS